MKKLTSTLALFVAGTLFFSFTAADDLKIGKKAPLTTLEMENVDNTMHTLEALKQQNGLLIVFSCNTCPFVVGNENFPGWERQYNTIYQKAFDAHIGMALVNSNEGKRADEDAFAAMQAHAKKKDYRMPYLLDKNSELANAFGAKTTPHVFLFDKNLELVYQGSIDNTWDPKRKSDVSYLSNAIANLSNGEAVKESTSSPKGCSIKRVSVKK